MATLTQIERQPLIRSSSTSKTVPTDSDESPVAVTGNRAWQSGVHSRSRVSGGKARVNMGRGEHRYLRWLLRSLLAERASSGFIDDGPSALIQRSPKSAKVPRCEGLRRTGAVQVMKRDVG